MDKTVERETADLAERVAGSRTQILTELRKVIVGQDEVVDEVLMALFCGGHCLITGVPGLAMLAPSGSCGAPSTKNGPSTVDSVVLSLPDLALP